MSNQPEYAHTLSPDDARVLDALVDSGFDVSSLPAADRQRGRNLVALFALLDDYPVEDGDDTLVHATLARIRRFEAAVAASQAAPAAVAEAPRRLRIPVPDFVTLAAVLLIGASIAWPVLSTVRERSIEAACVANMKVVHEGLTSYANEFEGRLPTAYAGFGRSIARIDLLPLVRYGYCEQGHINCPGRHSPQDPGYSFQMRPEPIGFTLAAAPDMALLGDRNPVIDASLSGMLLPPRSNSSNHGERGQNLLRMDGAIVWLSQPLVNGRDNIWLPADADGEHEYRPGAIPLRADDIFLAH
jgi:hypothetical protein